MRYRGNLRKMLMHEPVWTLALGQHVKALGVQMWVKMAGRPHTAVESDPDSACEDHPSEKSR
jgi:hypothetical protein